MAFVPRRQDGALSATRIYLPRYRAEDFRTSVSMVEQRMARRLWRTVLVTRYLGLLNCCLSPRANLSLNAASRPLKRFARYGFCGIGATYAVRGVVLLGRAAVIAPVCSTGTGETNAWRSGDRMVAWHSRTLHYVAYLGRRGSVRLTADNGISGLQ